MKYCYASPLRELVEPYVNLSHTLWTQFKIEKFDEIPLFPFGVSSFRKGEPIPEAVDEKDIILKINKFLSLEQASIFAHPAITLVYGALDTLSHNGSKSVSWEIVELISRFTERVWNALSALPIKEIVTHYLTDSVSLWQIFFSFLAVYFDRTCPGIIAFDRAGEIFFTRAGSCTKCGHAGSWKCGNCGTRYCSKQCQKDAWGRHKALCGSISEDSIVHDYFTKFPLPTFDHFDQSTRRFVFRRHPTLEFIVDSSKNGSFDY
jgi:hypothetical protein